MQAELFQFLNKVRELEKWVWSGAVRDRGVGPLWDRPGAVTATRCCMITTRRQALRDSDWGHCGHLGCDAVYSGWWLTFRSNVLPACSGWNDDGTSVMSTLTTPADSRHSAVTQLVCRFLTFYETRKLITVFTKVSHRTLARPIQFNPHPSSLDPF